MKHYVATNTDWPARVSHLTELHQKHTDKCGLS